jgi:hypothetical protein
MAKKDENVHLDVERTRGRSEDNCSQNERTEKKDQGQKTVVKNASASGLGTIGRNDQKIDKKESDFSDY